VLQLNIADLVIGGAAGKGPKHHYVPVFYTKQWAGLRERLCEYSRPRPGGEVKPRRTHPDGTGFVRGLNTIPNCKPEIAEHLEEVFLKRADSWAAKCLWMLNSENGAIWTSKYRSAWSRFILSLMFRNPEYVRRISSKVAEFFHPSSPDIEKTYQEVRKHDQPKTYAEYLAGEYNPVGRGTAVAVQRMIDSPNLGAFINAMRWGVIDLGELQYGFMTSDRPILMTDGIASSGGQIVLPIGPTALFIATTSVETEDMIRSITPRDLVTQVNDRVCLQAQKYVYYTDDRYINFVEKRLGQKYPSSPLDTAPI
jgi:hypothetical protein